MYQPVLFNKETLKEHIKFLQPFANGKWFCPYHFRRKLPHPQDSWAPNILKQIHQYTKILERREAKDIAIYKGGAKWAYRVNNSELRRMLYWEEKGQLEIQFNQK